MKYLSVILLILPLVFAAPKDQIDPKTDLKDIKLFFTFDEPQKNQLLVKAFANGSEYERLISTENGELYDLHDIKDALLAKQFSIKSLSMEALQLKIGLLIFDFKSKNLEKLNSRKIQIKQKIEVVLLREHLKWAQELKAGVEKSYLRFLQFMDEYLANYTKKMDEVELEESRRRAELETQLELIGGDQELLQKTKISKAQYRFSDTLKHQKIVLEKDNKKAGGSYFALIDGPVAEKGSSITFRVDQIITWAGAGLCLKSVVSRNKFDAESWYSRGHGSFMLFDYAKVYSNSNKEHNDVSKGFKFSKGDVIKVTTNGDRLMFENESTETRFNLKMSLSEDEWKDTAFCIYLTGGQVTILN